MRVPVMFIWCLSVIFVLGSGVLGDSCPLSSVTASECLQQGCVVFTVAVRLCVLLQVTVGDRLLPCVRAARSCCLLWPEFSETRGSQPYMCTRCACRVSPFSSGWCNMLQLKSTSSRYKLRLQGEIFSVHTPTTFCHLHRFTCLSMSEMECNEVHVF